MKNDFDTRIKNIEEELLALKTASLYTSIRNTLTAYSSTVRTGLYRVNYQVTNEAIISDFYSDKNKKGPGGIYPRTPQGNQQVVEVNTTYIGSDGVTPVTYDISLVVVSNVPVTSITRIS